MSFPLTLHLTTALAALPLGMAILLRPKGTPRHKMLGRLWVALVAVSATSSFALRDIANGALSWIHALSAFTLLCLAAGVAAMRYGGANAVQRHRRFMVGSFLGLVGAGAGALAPGRMLGDSLATLALAP